MKPKRLKFGTVWQVSDKVTKKKGNKFFIIVYASEQDEENIIEVCFEDSTKEDEMKGVVVANTEATTVEGDALMYEDLVFDEELDEDQELLEEEITKIEKLFNATIKTMAFGSGKKDVVIEEVTEDRNDEDLKVVAATEEWKETKVHEQETQVDVVLPMKEVMRNVEMDKVVNVYEVIQDDWYMELSADVNWWRWTDCGGLNPTRLEVNERYIWRMWSSFGGVDSTSRRLSTAKKFF